MYYHNLIVLGLGQRWVSKIQEYDLDNCSKKVIKGQILVEMLTESKNKAIKEGEEEKLCTTSTELENDDWYTNILYYLRNLSTPPPNSLIIREELWYWKNLSFS